MDPKFFPEDTVVGKMKNGKFCLAVVNRTPDMDSDDYDSDCDDDPNETLEKGFVHVSWYPEGVEEKVDDSKLEIVDRSTLPSDVVREKGGKQLGTVIDVEVAATVSILGTSKTLHIDANSLIFIDRFENGDVVTLDPWVGIVSDVYNGVTLKFPNGARGELAFSEDGLENLESVYPHPTDETLFVDEYAFYPGQVLIGPPSAFKRIVWLDKDKTFKFKPKSKCKVVIEKIDVFGVTVMWDQYAPFASDVPEPELQSPENPVSIDAVSPENREVVYLECSQSEDSVDVSLKFNSKVPPEFVAGTLLRRLRRLQHFWAGSLHLGQRYQHKLTAGEIASLREQSKSKSDKKRSRKNNQSRKPNRKQVKVGSSQKNLQGNVESQDATSESEGIVSSDNECASGPGSKDTDESSNLLVPETAPPSDIPSISLTHEQQTPTTNSHHQDHAEGSGSQDDEGEIRDFVTAWVTSLGLGGKMEKFKNGVCEAGEFVDALKEVFQQTSVVVHRKADENQNRSENVKKKINLQLEDPSYGLGLAVLANKPRDVIAALRHHCLSSNVGSVQAGAKAEYTEGQYVSVEVCATNTKMHVEWQDGSESRRLPSVQVVQAHHIDNNDFCPGDFVLDERESKMYTYGVVLKADSQSRMATVRWFQLLPNSSEVNSLHTEEVSVYEICDHPDYSFRISDVVSRVSAQSDIHVGCRSGDDERAVASSGCVGQILRATKDGKLCVVWSDGTRGEAYPHELLRRNSEDSVDFLDSDSDSSTASGSTESWESTVSDSDVTPSVKIDLPVTEEAAQEVDMDLQNMEGPSQTVDALTATDPSTGDAKVSTDGAAPTTHHFIASPLKPLTTKTFMSALRRDHNHLRNSLPDGIYVKTYEDRMDLFSFLFLGPANTPYEDGLFAFDARLPGDYPLSPPDFHYVSFSHRLNPNLYEDGKVCVSLLGTWSGRGNEKWTKESNLLQVLVSIQGLILNAEPYFNEAGYEGHRGTSEGEMNSRCYNEMVILRMVEHMSRLVISPPAPFEDFCKKMLPQLVPRLIERVERLVESSDDGSRSQATGDQLSLCYPLLPLSKGVLISLRQKLKVLRNTVTESAT